MLRAALLTLLVASVVTGSVEGQHSGAAFHGNAAAPPVRSGFPGQHGFSNRFSSRRGFPANGFRRDSFGSFFLPYYEPFGYEQAEAEGLTNRPVPPVEIRRTPEPPIPNAQLIEIPRAANATAKVLPPTVFILANGERLETRRFVLSASLLSVNIDRRERTVPLDMLDLNATLASNRERGINLYIPDDRNEISVSF